VALGKLLKLGGIDNSIPRTQQSLGRFRVARNVRPTVDGYIVPRSGQEDLGMLPAGINYIHYMSQHNNDKLSIVDKTGVNNVVVLKNSFQIPMQVFPTGESCTTAVSNVENNSFMSYMRNNTTYFFNPYIAGNRSTQALFKYDGVEISSAGVLQPKVFSTDYNVIASPSLYVRVIQHQMDFQNNEPVSEFVQFEANNVSLLNISSNGGNLIGSPEVIPSTVIESKGTGIFGTRLTDTNYFRVGVTYTYNAGTNDFTVTTSDTNIQHASQIGSYVFVRNFFIEKYVSALSPNNGLSENSYIIALKIKSVLSSGSIKLDAANIKVLNSKKEWVTPTLIDVPAFIASLDLYGTRKYYSIWTSTTVNGNYVFRYMLPAFPESIGSSDSTFVSVTGPSDVRDFGFSMGNNLGDWYDVTSLKLCLNSVYPFGNLLGICNFQDLLIAFSDDLLWFSDTTQPQPSYEQFSKINFIKVGDTQDGKVVSVCGTADFLYVGRERKNYYITGNITTGNYRVKEIPEAEVGPWVNNASINIKDYVIIITAIGMYAIEDGGRCTKISNRVSQNFNAYSDIPTPEDVVFKLSGTTGTTLTPVNSLAGLSIAYDEFREYIAICQKNNVAGNPVLLFHVPTTEFYEWENLNIDQDKQVSCIHFQDSYLYVGEFDIGYTNAVETVENRTIPLDGSISPAKLYLAWMTAEEPSLEKQALQLKIFGSIYPESNTESLEVVHFKDWDISTKLTDAMLIPISGTYYHKKRLNSDKVLALSCGIEVNNNTTFRFEGMEVEFMPIQQGMKK
jgi:hypothetical protein